MLLLSGPVISSLLCLQLPKLCQIISCLFVGMSLMIVLCTVDVQIQDRKRDLGCLYGLIHPPYHYQGPRQGLRYLFWLVSLLISGIQSWALMKQWDFSALRDAWLSVHIFIFPFSTFSLKPEQVAIIERVYLKIYLHLFLISFSIRLFTLRWSFGSKKFIVSKSVLCGKLIWKFFFAQIL